MKSMTFLTLKYIFHLSFHHIVFFLSDMNTHGLMANKHDIRLYAVSFDLYNEQEL